MTNVVSACATQRYQCGQRLRYPAIPMRSALALLSHSRQNDDNCFGLTKLLQNTILNMRSG